MQQITLNTNPHKIDHIPPTRAITYKVTNLTLDHVTGKDLETIATSILLSLKPQPQL